MILAADSYATPIKSDRSRYIAYGGGAEMIRSTAKELLFEGPANSGKTRAVLEKCYLQLTEFEGLRMLWLRKTRKSLSQSVLTTWEEEVLPPRHPCITGTATKEHRDTYTFPNGSVVVLGGMDRPDKVMSTQYDVIVYFEATEGEQREWNRLVTRVRNKTICLGLNAADKRPVFFHQLIADCNPGSEYHWLNKRANEGHMHRVRARHADNPIFDSDDQDRLDSLSGADRRRLRDGEWCSEDGQVLECWDAATMMCFRKELLIDQKRPTGGYKFDWLFGSIDFGMRHATVFQIWGVLDDSMYRVVEIYKRGLPQDWWAEKIAYQMKKWRLEAIVADGGGLGIQLIDYLNDQLGSRGGRDTEALVRPARKGPGSRLLGFKQVQDKMLKGQLILCHDAQEEGPCKVSLDAYQPTCTEQEIPAFTWAKNKDGGPIKDDSDRSKVDDGIFAMIYACDFKWGRDLATPPDRSCKPGTVGDYVNHDEWLSGLDKPEYEEDLGDLYEHV